LKKKTISVFDMIKSAQAQRVSGVTNYVKISKMPPFQKKQSQVVEGNHPGIDVGDNYENISSLHKSKSLINSGSPSMQKENSSDQK
jgi:hypothetical protein